MDYNKSKKDFHFDPVNRKLNEIIENQNKVTEYLRQIEREQEQIRSELNQLRSEVCTIPLDTTKLVMEIIKTVYQEKYYNDRMDLMVTSIKDAERSLRVGIRYLQDGVKKVAKTPKRFPKRNSKFSWKDHIMFTLDHEGRPLLSSEIFEIHLEQRVKGRARLSEIQKYTSRFLTELVKAGRVIKYKPKGASKFYYCHPTWVNEEGELKEEYLKKSPLL